jgi:hypothetical protein
MAGKKTSLITGSNAKIKINGVTMAYATDIQYDVTVSTIPVETMGRYEVLSNEPIATTVSGSFSVVRYTNRAKPNGISGAAANGNGIGQWGTRAGGEGSAIAGSNSGMSTHVNPGDILTSTTVDIEVYQKFTNDPGDATGQARFKRLQDCRVTRQSASVNKRGVLMESYQFIGELADDDSFVLKISGEEDLSV